MIFACQMLFRPGAGVPVQLVHDLEARIEREQKNLPPLNHGSFPPSNNSNVTYESRYMVAVHLPSPRSALLAGA